MRHFFVINPHSFKANKDDMVRILTEIENCFSGEHHGEYNVHISRYPRDAVAVVHRFISSCPKDETVRVYAVGGDGILFECLNGMVDFSNAELSSIPYGNANDFPRAFGDNKDVIERFRNIKALTTAPAHPMDIIDCGSNYAFNEVNIGMIGHTIIQANSLFPILPKKWLRRNIGLAYTLAGLRALLNRDLLKQKYTITIDGDDISGNYCNIHIANSSFNGGTLCPSPYAMPNDGLLNGIFTSSTTLFNIMLSINDYNKGLFEKYNFFKHKTFKTMEISSDEVLHAEMDGEGFYAKDFTIKIIPGGIKVFAPEGLDFVDFSHMAYKFDKAFMSDKKTGG